MKNKIILIFMAFAVVGAGVFLYLKRERTEAAATAAEVYYCPMHPDYTSLKPGECPICHMDLVKKESGGGQKTGETVPAPSGRIKFYRNPMNPEMISRTPAKDEMGMDYIPVYGDGDEKTKKGIEISGETRELIGVKTGYAGKKDFILKIRASGKIAYDPALYNAINEHRQNLRTFNSISSDPAFSDERDRMGKIADSSGLRLRQMGLSEEEIAGIEKSDYANLLLSGETVWGYFYFYEEYLPYLKPGGEALVRVQAYPGEMFYGLVKSIDRIISAETRTIKARVEIKNRKEALKPEMYAEAEISLNLGKRLLIPSDSLVKTGDETVIYAVNENGGFEKRSLKTGLSDAGYTEVISGLKEGEKIVISSNFLIDSESKLKGK
ncbi:MAG: hypothetical protein COT17_01855 [Elusimicrobia bacterium CG08_land_8_20_14_0_20_51_18]|nr:MAG: hypothetical protein COT17_01855 [Elusimicrobia bacterium CG08_land_8_20_14_0_20_51_18]